MVKICSSVAVNANTVSVCNLPSLNLLCTALPVYSLSPRLSSFLLQARAVLCTLFTLSSIQEKVRYVPLPPYSESSSPSPGPYSTARHNSVMNMPPQAVLMPPTSSWIPSGSLSRRFKYCHNTGSNWGAKTSANIPMGFLKTSMISWFGTEHTHTHLSHNALYSKSTSSSNAILRQRSLFKLTCF